jgi:hypothetical protein
MQNPHLQNLQARAHENRVLAQDLLRDLSPSQLAWNPAPKSWNALEVLDHINNAAEKYFAGIRQTIEQTRARALRDSGAFRPGFLQGRFIQMLEPKPGARALPAPGRFVPQKRHEADCAVRDRFFENADALQQLLGEADGLHLSKVRFASPVTPLLRFNLGEAFWLLVAHENRHLLQIQRIRSHPGFPGGTTLE